MIRHLAGVLVALLVCFGRASAVPTEIERVAYIQPLLASSASQIDPLTFSAIIVAESSAWPWTIHDNTTDKAYYLDDYQSAVLLAHRLLDIGHNLDLGLSAINDSNLPGYHLTVDAVFIPRVNIWTGGQILSSCHRTEVKILGSAWVLQHESDAARMVASCYNSNSLFKAKKYVASVIAAARYLATTPVFASPYQTPARRATGVRIPVFASRAATITIGHNP